MQPGQRVIQGQPRIVVRGGVNANYRFVRQPQRIIVRGGVPGRAGFAQAYTQYAQFGNQYRNMWVQSPQKVVYIRRPDGTLVRAIVKPQVTVTAAAAATAATTTAAAKDASSSSSSKDAIKEAQDEYGFPLPKTRDAKGLKEWDKEWVKFMKKQPQDLTDMTPILAHVKIFATSEAHSLYKDFNDAIQECLKRVNDVQAKDVGEDSARQAMLDGVVDAIQTIVPAFLTHYKDLKGRQQLVEDSLFEYVFQRLHDIVFNKYTERYKSEDDAHLKVFKSFNNISPAHLGINKRFWLTDKTSFDPATPPEQLPYGEAISILKQLPACKTSNECVQCLSDTGKAIYGAITKYYEGKPPPEVTADEFLPLFAFVAIRSQVENPFSTCKYIEDFMSEKESVGEKGYVLVTFQTSMSFVIALDQKEVDETIRAITGAGAGSGAGSGSGNGQNALFARLAEGAASAGDAGATPTTSAPAAPATNSSGTTSSTGVTTSQTNSGGSNNSGNGSVQSPTTPPLSSPTCGPITSPQMGCIGGMGGIGSMGNMNAMNMNAMNMNAMGGMGGMNMNGMNMNMNAMNMNMNAMGGMGGMSGMNMNNMAMNRLSMNGMGGMGGMGGMNMNGMGGMNMNGMNMNTMGGMGGMNGLNMSAGPGVSEMNANIGSPKK